MIVSGRLTGRQAECTDQAGLCKSLLVLAPCWLELICCCSLPAEGALRGNLWLSNPDQGVRPLWPCRLLQASNPPIFVADIFAHVSRECQREHWAAHKPNCRSTPESEARKQQSKKSAAATPKLLTFENAQKPLLLLTYVPDKPAA